MPQHKPRILMAPLPVVIAITGDRHPTIKISTGVVARELLRLTHGPCGFATGPPAQRIALPTVLRYYE